MNKDIVVIGGGTAGWFTALMINKTLPECKVTLVESEQIGILGAGESTVGIVLQMLDYLGISLPELIKNTDATFKNGLKSTNWHGDGTSYFHNFRVPKADLDFFNAGHAPEVFGLTDPLNAINFINNTHTDFDINSRLASNSKVGYIHRPQKDLFGEYLGDFYNVANFSMHFNASKLAMFLRSVAESRGVKRVEGIVTKINSNPSGDIESIIIDGHNQINLDFLFDCSGLARLVIGKHFGVKFKGYQDKLPVNKAIPFFMPQDTLPSYTEARAMKYGWMWKIPLQSRYGCGYVFDSNQTTEDEAYKEIVEIFGEVESPKTFNFSAGIYEEVWKNNCIAIGLSAGFIEPLEATAIAVLTTTLRKILANPYAMFNRDQRHTDNFNEFFRYWNSRIMDFIYFHYMTERSDTSFWQGFKDISKAPESIQEMLEVWKYKIPETTDYNSMDPFSYMSWMQVGAGTRNLNTDLIKKSALYNQFDKKYSGVYTNINYKLEQVVTESVNHKQFINYILENH